MASVSATTSSDRIAQRFAELRRADRRAFVAYVTAGHPDVESSVALLQGLQEIGADVIELGVPFSDPMADGSVIQASSQKALENGVRLDGVLDIVSRADLRIPTVLFSYLNPLLRGGPDMLQRAADAGVDGVLAVDLPLGADPEREAWFAEGPLDYIRLVAPTTPQDRIAEIAKTGSGFVYLISRLGVTGERDELPADRRSRARRDLAAGVRGLRHLAAGAGARGGEDRRRRRRRQRARARGERERRRGARSGGGAPARHRRGLR